MHFLHIVRKGLSTLPPHLKITTFQNHPRCITRIPLHLLISPIPTLLANQSSQVFLINRNATVKLSSINTIHVKQQHNVGFFIFKFTLKYMLGNVYINKIHARQCLYIISLYCTEVFPILSISLLYPKESFTYNFKTARKKRFFNGATSNWFLYVTM